MSCTNNIVIETELLYHKKKIIFSHQISLFTYLRIAIYVFKLMKALMCNLIKVNSNYIESNLKEIFLIIIMQ